MGSSNCSTPKARSTMSFSGGCRVQLARCVSPKTRKTRAGNRRRYERSDATALDTAGPDRSVLPRQRYCRCLALFGSVLRDDFGPESDIDILVRFEAEARPTLFDFGRMERELAAIFEREVDLVSWRAIERSANKIRRNAILNAAEPIYGS